MRHEDSFTRTLGFSLLEVLIALVVLSVGLIGIGALTVKSLQSVHSSLFTSVASAAALDFEERLWLEVGGLSEGDGCPTVGFLGDFRADWTATANQVGLPGLAVNVGSPEVFARENDVDRNAWVRVSLSLVWREERFGVSPADSEEDNEDTAGSCEPGFECFRYIASAPCRRS